MENKTYVISFKRYNIIKNSYVYEEAFIKTNDINDVYRMMGRIIAYSIDDIREMRYRIIQ